MNGLISNRSISCFLLLFSMSYPILNLELTFLTNTIFVLTLKISFKTNLNHIRKSNIVLKKRSMCPTI